MNTVVAKVYGLEIFLGTEGFGVWLAYLTSHESSRKGRQAGKYRQTKQGH